MRRRGDVLGAARFQSTHEDGISDRNRDVCGTPSAVPSSATRPLVSTGCAPGRPGDPHVGDPPLLHSSSRACVTPACGTPPSSMPVRGNHQRGTQAPGGRAMVLPALNHAAGGPACASGIWSAPRQWRLAPREAGEWCLSAAPSELARYQNSLVSCSFMPTRRSGHLQSSDFSSAKASGPRVCLEIACRLPSATGRRVDGLVSRSSGASWALNPREVAAPRQGAPLDAARARFADGVSAAPREAHPPRAAAIAAMSPPPGFS